MQSIHPLRRPRALIAVALAGATFGVFSAGPVVAADIPASVKALIPAAQKEGEATIFGTTLNPRQVAAFNKSFNTFYGTRIKLNQIGGRHTRKSAEVVQALRNNVPSGLDVFWTSSPPVLINGGALRKFNWSKAFGLSPNMMLGEYGIRTHDGHLNMVTVNTNLVKRSEEPRTYADLLNPKWRGKIAAPRSPSPWAMLSYAIGEEEAVKFLRQLLTKQKLKLLARYPDVRARVVGGEFAIGIGTDAFAEISKGAPVRHPDMDIVVLNTQGAYILKDAKHPNVAKLWGYWAISKQGQKTLEKQRGYSLAGTKGSALHAYVQGKKVSNVPFEWRMKNDKRLAKKFRAILKQKKGRK